MMFEVTFNRSNAQKTNKNSILDRNIIKFRSLKSEIETSAVCPRTDAVAENGCFYAPKRTIALSERSRDAIRRYLKLLGAIGTRTIAFGRVLDHCGGNNWNRSCADTNRDRCAFETQERRM